MTWRPHAWGRRLGASAAALAVGMGVMTGCSSGHHTATIHYVALGDSYASGEGNPPFDAGTDVTADRCHRSGESYPRLATASAPLALTFRACSGATIADIADVAQYPGEPAQVGAVTGQTNVVTVTIGGNDAGFGTIIPACFLDLSTRSLGDASADARIQALSTPLTNAYAAIRTRAPDAKVLVVGYPDIFPPVPSGGGVPCPQYRIAGIGLGADQLVALRSRTHELDTVIEDAATKAGTQYVDVEGVLAGHELCTAAAWVRGISSNRGTFHPSPEGQAAMAAVVSAAMAGVQPSS